MQDVQNQCAEVPLSIDCVGVKGLRLPLAIRGRAGNMQHTVACVEMGVELPAKFRGTHISRFVEALEGWCTVLDHASIQRLLRDMLQRLTARTAHIHINFPYFIRKKAPATGITSLMTYDCNIACELAGTTPSYQIRLTVPVMTVCPCSKAISREGAHSQRALIFLSVRTRYLPRLEPLIKLAETSGSSALYTLLKREDEKYVTEDAFANPTFVEDVARNLAQKLYALPRLPWFCVEVESAESIHAHSAFARLEKQNLST